MIQKGLSAVLVENILLDLKQKKNIEAFEEMAQEEEETNSKSGRDEDIEDVNRYRKIKKVLDEESLIFYELTGTINESQLSSAKIANKHNM